MSDFKLSDQIAAEIAKGIPEADIHAAFAAKGWSPEDINGAFAIAKIQQGSFSAAKYSNVMQPTSKAKAPSHGAGFFFEILIVAVLLISAPGAYGLVTQVFWPAAKGEPVAIEDTAKGYELLRDVPSLIPVGGGATKTSGGTSTKAPVSPSGSSRTTTTTTTPPPPPAPAVSIQLSQSSPKAPSVSFSASNRTITPGASIVLSWRADDAASCTGIGFDTENKNRGSLRVSVPVSVKYTLTCTNAAGSTVRRLSVTAEVPTPTPDPTPNPTPSTYTITASAGSNGSISPSGSLTLTSAASQAYAIIPASGYQIATMTIDGSSVTPASTHTFSNISANHTIAATFSAVSVTPPPVVPVPLTYTLTASAGANGTISPSGTATVAAAANQTYTIHPASGYQVATVVVDGSSVTPTATYAFSNVTRNHTIAVTFSLVPVVTPPTNPDPTPQPPVPDVPDSPGSYSVYPSCEAPARSYTREIYIDPAGGSDTGNGSRTNPYKTLEAVIAAKTILASGDHIVLMAGYHGNVLLDRSAPGALRAGGKWTWLDFRPGATAYGINLQYADKWLITGAELTHPDGSANSSTFGYFVSDSNLVMADSWMYTRKNASSLSVAEWLSANNGIYFKTSGQCVASVRNRIQNTRQALFAAVGDETASFKALLQDNHITGFSDDAIRINGSDSTVRGNYIADEYVGSAEGDGNHDDGIQIASKNGVMYSNVTIDHNWVQQMTDPSRAHTAPIQGIFGGTLGSNVRITNNVVIASQGNGLRLTICGSGTVDHNTVANPIAGGNKTLLSMYGCGTDANGVANPAIVTVTNNTAWKVGGGVLSNNVDVVDPRATYQVFDPANNRYDFHGKPGSVLDGKDAGALWNNPVAIVDIPTFAAAPTPVKLSLLASVAAAAFTPFDWAIHTAANAWHAFAGLFAR